MPTGKNTPKIIIVLSIVALAVIVKYSLSRSTTTANNVANNNVNAAEWKIYSNSLNGLFFQYPPNRIIREYQNPFEARIMDADEPERDGARATGPIAGPGDIGITRLATYYENPQDYLTSTFTLRAEMTTVTIAGGPGYRVTYSQPLGLHQDDLILYVFNNTGKTWVVRLDQTGVASSTDEFEAIVKTIKIKNHPPIERRAHIE